MNADWARWRGKERSEREAVGPEQIDDEVRVRLARALARFPEAQEALRQALIAEGWLVP